MKDCRAGSFCVDEVWLLALACALAPCDAALACRACRDVAFLPTCSAAWLWLAALLLCGRDARPLSRCPARSLRTWPLPPTADLPGSRAASGTPCREWPVSIVPAPTCAMPATLPAPVVDDSRIREALSPPRRAAGLFDGAPTHRIVRHVPASRRRAALLAIGSTRRTRRASTRRTPARALPCSVLACLLALGPDAPRSPCAGLGATAGSLTRATRARRIAARQHHDGRGRHAGLFRLRAERSCARHRSFPWR
ncbi:hypothetical protein [Burkholderia stagnalis]|uniref:hypothetical protein n=1 Tax=Burkholderia stagnalis TaxID=1503054 RepID=UPI000F800E74|nr:hypothetical protein [Burkholderia stagnalis]